MLSLNHDLFPAGTSLNKVFREGTTAMLHCLTKSESKVVLTSWNKIDPTTSITAHEIFKFNEAKDAGQSRYSLAENRLVVSEIKISDEGCYRQQVFDSSRRQVEECNITVTVYGEQDINNMTHSWYDIVRFLTGVMAEKERKFALGHFTFPFYWHDDQGLRIWVHFT